MSLSNREFSESKILRPIEVGGGSHHAKGSMSALVLAAIGIVFGDIGTSPLYALKECFNPEHGIPFSVEAVYGVISLVFWAFLLVVSLKYVLFVMRANNHGEGGILALMAMALRTAPTGSKRALGIMMLGVFGACMFYGDAVITPAISVLSAVEGLEVVSPDFKRFVLPITITILVALFLIQKHGTKVVGVLFGPIMMIWFFTLAGLGVYNLMEQPEILWAANPMYGLMFLMEHRLEAFVVLGAVFLVLTGAEALYADMGHFGRFPIRLAWFGFVLPALIINYFGQGALVLSNPEAVKNPFYLLAPEWSLFPLIILATLAAVIASQAVITGAFSVSRQALQLGYIPRMHVEHTSESEEGQIYMPRVNWGLMLAIMVLVLGFKSSGNLAAAYGIAVTLTMAITTALTFFVIYKAWKLPLVLALGATGFFLVVDLFLFAGCAIKLWDGGWFPLLIGAVMDVFLTGLWLPRAGAIVAGVAAYEFEEDPQNVMEPGNGTDSSPTFRHNG